METLTRGPDAGAVSPSPRKVSALSLVCLTSIGLLCHTAHHPLVRPLHATPPTRSGGSGQTLPFQVFFFSCGLASRNAHPTLPPAVISLLASRIPCFQGADSQFNPPVLYSSPRLIAVFVRVHTRCHLLPACIVRRASRIGIAPVHVWRGTVAPGAQ